MAGFYELFLTAGLFSFLLLLLGIFATAFGVLAIVLAFVAPRAGVWVASASLIASLAIPGLGACDEIRKVAGAREASEQAIADIQADVESTLPDRDPQLEAELEPMRRRIEAQLVKDASASTALGLYFGALPCSLSLLAVLVAFSRRRRARLDAIFADRTLSATVTG